MMASEAVKHQGEELEWRNRGVIIGHCRKRKQAGKALD